MAINVALVVIGVIVLLMVAGGCFYLLVFFQHPEDKNTAIFPKVIVVVGLTLTCVNILLLPFDVANSRLYSDLPMPQIWEAIYIIMGVWGLGVIPFGIFFYEAEDPDAGVGKQIKAAVIQELITLVVFIGITLLFWFFLGIAEVPVVRLEGTPVAANLPLSGNTCLNCVSTAEQINYNISFILYIISMLTLLGLVLFIIFGGIGLAALPMDLINGFRKRPKQIKLQVYLERKEAIGKRAAALLESGRKLNGKLSSNAGGRPKNRSQARDYNKFRTGVWILDQDYKRLEASYNKGIGPRILRIVWDYTQLILGIIGLVISICWFLHLILYVAISPPVTGFLNDFFIAVDNAFSLFGVFFFGIFAFYLLWCVFKGNFKFGLRFPLLFAIHPMKPHETLMNAFMFNTLLLLLASFCVVQFCSLAFPVYIRFTGIDSLFNVGVRNLRGFKYIWRYYFYALIALPFLSLIYFIAFPSDRKQAEKNLNKTALP